MPYSNNGGPWGGGGGDDEDDKKSGGGRGPWAGNDRGGGRGPGGQPPVPDLDEIVTTNTVPVAEEKRLPNFVVRSVAPLFAETVHRIHAGESVSSLFSDAETYG